VTGPVVPPSHQPPHAYPGYPPPAYPPPGYGHPPRNRALAFMSSVGGLLTGVATLITALVAVCGFIATRPSDDPGSTTGGTGNGTAVTSAAARPPAALTVFFGPGEVVFQTNGVSAVDLDRTPPLVADTDGADIKAGQTTGAPSLFVNVAPLQPGGADPSGADCAAWVRDNLARNTGSLTTGDRFCMTTDQGRVAYVRVVGAPVGKGTVRLNVTVWQSS
jgi:hypothetical protein